MADDQARPEVIQEEGEEEDAGVAVPAADGATDVAAEAEEGQDTAAGKTEDAAPAEGTAEGEKTQESADGEKTQESAEGGDKDNANETVEERQEGGETPKPEDHQDQPTVEESPDKQVSEDEDAERQPTEEQGTGQETSEEQAVAGEASDKPSEEQIGDDKQASQEQVATETEAHEGGGDGEATAEEQEKTDQPETGEGSASPKPEAEGTDETPKPEGEGEGGAEGEGGVQEGAAEQGEAAAQDEAGAEGEAAEKVEGQATAEAPVEGEAATESETKEEDAVKKEEEQYEEAAEEIKEKPSRISPIPENDSFGEGEREESPIVTGEKLSREGTPTLHHDPTKFQSPPEPGTPTGEAEEEEDYPEQPQYTREQLIEKYHQAISERQQLQEQNYQLQNKLAEYFRKKKSEDVRQETNVTDQEQRYLKYMANLDELRRQDIEERERYKQQIEELKEKCDEKKQRVDEERMKFLEFKRQVAMGAVNSRSGRPIPVKDIEQYLSMENRKEAEVVNVRLENIKLRNKLRKKEQILKSKEELAEGLHLIDFEQLKIENQTYNEKIEERNEELLKLRKKITNTVQVLTHLKEKLQFVQAENHVQQKVLQEVEETAAKKRDILTRTKQARDALRIDNQKLRQNCGLLGNESLLRDFEERKDESEELNNQLERLKMMHAELTLNLNSIRTKIEHAHTIQQ